MSRGWISFPADPQLQAEINMKGCTQLQAVLGRRTVQASYDLSSKCSCGSSTGRREGKWATGSWPLSKSMPRKHGADTHSCTTGILTVLHVHNDDRVSTGEMTSLSRNERFYAVSLLCGGGLIYLYLWLRTFHRPHLENQLSYKSRQSSSTICSIGILHEKISAALKYMSNLWMLSLGWLPADTKLE